MIEEEFIIAVKYMLKNLPAYTKKKYVYLITGRETTVEYNPVNGKLKIVKKSCTNCGQCCLNLIPNSIADIHWGTDEEGRCLKLKKDGSKWICIAGMDTPIRCFPDVRLNCEECEMEYYEEEIFF